MTVKRAFAPQLDRDINFLKASQRAWRCLYDDQDWARAQRIIAYLEELKQHRNESLEKSRVSGSR